MCAGGHVLYEIVRPFEGRVPGTVRGCGASPEFRISCRTVVLHYGKETDVTYNPADLKILCIDDNKCMQQIYTITLNAMGFETIIAAWNGAEALEIMDRAPGDFDLVFCDLYMAPVDGFEFLEQLRSGAGDFNPGTPVIVVSGTANIKNVDQAKKAGANAFLAKPISVQKLLTSIRSVMENPLVFQGEDEQQVESVKTISI